MALGQLHLPVDATLLDVGTGMGTFAIFLAMQGYRVVTGEPATDRSQYAGRDWAANAQAAGVLDRIRFEAFDAGRMPFAGDSFDSVFFFGVLHHIEEGLRRDVLREALRVVKGEGAVVFFEPRREMLERIWVDDPGHPLAADPSLYLPGEGETEQRLQGAWMDVYVYRKGTTR